MWLVTVLFSVIDRFRETCLNSMPRGLPSTDGSTDVQCKASKFCLGQKHKKIVESARLRCPPFPLFTAMAPRSDMRVHQTVASQLNIAVVG
jgi:hypothetical protein